MPFTSLLRPFLFFFVSVFSSHAAAHLSGQIARVDDGDTLTLLDAKNQAYTLRLLGIDAPELSQESGEAARNNLSRLAFGRAASAKCVRRPPAAPLLCTVYVDGDDVGLKQILDGMAWRYHAHANEQNAEDRAGYEQAEFMAKIRRRGLWKATNPTPPWIWRGNRPEQ
ncbi:MAG: thermonuclease family protein [Candidatus Accumulibacter sp.]|jgi:endonuclease YncB( thermonuclease family)|nr:thermonuclease family protein [Accumulibacter sp.]